MKVLFDFIPVLVFFIAFKIPEDPHQGILLATAVAITASLLQVTLFWIKTTALRTCTLSRLRSLWC
jgi:intracellular septation protein